MGNKLYILLSTTTKQLLLLGDILGKHDLQDLKWQIILSIPETNDIITSWLFASKYLHLLPEIIDKQCIFNFPQRNLIYDKFTIEKFESVATFENNTEFMSFFDIYIQTYILYFNILGAISTSFEMYPPQNDVSLNFSDIVNNIIKNGNNYALLENTITIPIMVGVVPTNIVILIKQFDRLPNHFIGIFDKIKGYVLEFDNNVALCVHYVVGEIIYQQSVCDNDLFTIQFIMK